MRAALRGLTTRGRSLLAAGLTASLMALVLDQTDVLRVGVLVTALPLLAAAGVSRTRFRLAGQRVVSPSRVRAGDQATVVLRLENVSSLPTGLLLVEDRAPVTLGARPRFVVDRLAPRTTREVQYPVRSDTRGRFLLGPLAVRVTDPFGLCQLDRTFSQQDLFVVTPQVEQLDPLPLAGDRSGSGDSRSRSVAAAGEDDVAVREYRHGDELRRVHWRATAHMGQLMVRREEQPWESRCTVLLDARPDAHRGSSPDSSYERLVVAAASIGTHLGRRGYSVRLVSGAGGVASAAHEPGTVPGDNEGLLLDALAVVQPEPRTDIEQIAATVRQAQDGLLVLLLGSLTAEDADRLVHARHGMGTTIAVLAEVDDWRPRRGDTDAPPAPGSGPAATLLRMAGWRVVPLRRREPVGTYWRLASRTAEGMAS